MLYSEFSSMVITLSRSGVIEFIENDPFSLSEYFPSGRNFIAGFSRDNLPKLLDFFETINRTSAAQDWEFVLQKDDAPLVLYVSGFLSDNRIILIAAGERKELLKDVARYLENSPVVSPLEESADSGKDIINRNIAQDETVLEDLILLNNEYANLQRTLAKRNQKLKQLIKEKNQFLAIASHDLRKPLSVILSFTDFVRDEAGDILSDEHIDFLNRVYKSAENMRTLIDDYLDYAAIESGEIELRKKPVKLEDLYRTCLAVTNILAQRRSVTIRQIKPDCDIVLNVDTLKIEQVLSNILENAVQRSDEGSSIIFAAECGDDSVEFIVEDNGPGMSEDELKKLFTPYFRGSAQKKTGEKSTGMGLLIAKKIIDAHGGKISAESEKGKGSVFKITLPRG